MRRTRDFQWLTLGLNPRLSISGRRRPGVLDLFLASYAFGVGGGTSNGLGLHRRLLHGLADPSRLVILEAMRGQERRVGDLAVETGLSQPNVSKHLACLWGCGLVARERRGREVYYRPIDGIEELFGAMDDVIERAGMTIGACPLTDKTLEPSAL